MKSFILLSIGVVLGIVSVFAYFIFASTGGHTASIKLEAEHPKWMHSQLTDEFTDRVDHYATISSMMSARRDIPFVSVACYRGELQTSIGVGQYLGGPGKKIFKYRVDSRPMVNIWVDELSAVAPYEVSDLKQSDVYSFVKQLLTGDSLLLSLGGATGYGEYRFPLAGASDAIEPVLKACNTSI